MIVHRKGATPAGKDVLGIIPGSMTAPGFIVKGKGEAASLSSASHGAGRRMSRTAAIKSITHEALRDELKKHGVKLIGGGWMKHHQLIRILKQLCSLKNNWWMWLVNLSQDRKDGWIVFTQSLKA